MSSGSVIGRCNITVPAAEKITTRIIRMTPVLMELRVCQVLRNTERFDGAIGSSSFALGNARSEPTANLGGKSLKGTQLDFSSASFVVGWLGHNTHSGEAAREFHPRFVPSDYNHTAAKSGRWAASR